MNALKRVLSAFVAGGLVFVSMYVGTRYGVAWVVGLIILIFAYPAAVEYLQLMKKLDVPLAAPEFLIWVPVLVFSYVIFKGRYADVVLLLAIAYQVLRYLRSLPHRTGFLQAVAGVFGRCLVLLTLDGSLGGVDCDPVALPHAEQRGADDGGNAATQQGDVEGVEIGDRG